MPTKPSFLSFWSRKKDARSKKRKKGPIREWTEALLFAVIAASIIRGFILEAFTIPTSSMEKSLLVGDFLFVSKYHYGARTPITPISFPLVHNEMPIFGGDSYLESVQLPYYRLPGLSEIERRDVVVFNYPQDADHPVDKRDNYIKRCVALPGDTFEIRNRRVFIDGKPEKWPATFQFAYLVKTNGNGFSERALRRLDITDYFYNPQSGIFEMYMTEKAAQAIGRMRHVEEVLPKIQPDSTFNPYVYPYYKPLPWNVDNYGPLVIPRAGMSVAMTPVNYHLYGRCIRDYERPDSQLKIQDGQVYLDGQALDRYTFEMDYYFMMGDNRHNSKDSRYWGFVPQNHILGKAILTWFSLDSKAPSLGERVRWERIGSMIEHGD